MLYYLSFPLSMTYSGFNVFRYITFRAAMAALLALLISFLLGPWLIRTLTEKQIGQQIRDDGPACHAVKAGTPTMGGALIILALLFSTLMMADIANRYVLLALIATVGTGVVGFADDYLKLTRKNSRGLPPRGKLLGQFAGGIRASPWRFIISPGSAPKSPCRSSRTFHFDLGPFYVPFAMLVIVVHFQRRQSDRRIGRIGDRPGDDRRGHLCGHRLCDRPFKVRRLSANPLCRGSR